MRVLELEDLTITLLDDEYRLQTGKLSQWRTLEEIRIECENGLHTLVHGLTCINLEAPEAEQIAEMLNKEIFFDKWTI